MIVYCPHCNQKYEMDDNVTEFICLSCGMKSTESGYFEKHKKSLLWISAGIIVVMFALLTYSNHREMTNLRKKIAQTEHLLERKAIHYSICLENLENRLESLKKTYKEETKIHKDRLYECSNNIYHLKRSEEQLKNDLKQLKNANTLLDQRITAIKKEHTSRPSQDIDERLLPRFRGTSQRAVRANSMEAIRLQSRTFR